MRIRKLALLLLFAPIFFTGNLTLAAEIVKCQFGYGYQKIGIKGNIEQGDFKKFKDLFNEITQSKEVVVSVGLASQGGNILEAMKIGLMVREFFIKTEAPYKYSQENLNSCFWHLKLDDDESCAVDEDSDGDCTCESACFLIWAAGVVREGDVLGLHRPYFSKDIFQGLSGSEAKAKYAKLSNGVRAYLQKMGIPNHIIEKMFEYSSGDIFYLKKNTIKSMEKVPFFDEWIIANCGIWSDEEMEMLAEFFVKGEKLSKADNFYSDYLHKKYTKFLECRDEKIREVQLK